ncbi:benzoate/H(+) symporter BenE family transporter [Polynucleobacter sp. MWH-UH35A]|uniref:benzoate/H(+) symporter BenE family transporter n=1 Tax=Polynucleobacter sp. MWH-UH35A TaxID=1855619 RepID=UPI001BFD7099|nr:benzoate/H(+) symporter BenE family transporter [Polynucleobacter sp. MWH-UH35A]QWD59492.1 benzoate/H(+) symporter BenE family transporter [Polynucleobacter sp. MWH-UH35A]
MKRSFFEDISLSAITAGFLVVLISYAGPMLIFFQAASLAQVSNEVLASWVWGVSIGGGLSGLYLSWKYKMPIITAWSAPGAALLVTLFPHMSVNEAISSYLTAAAIIFLIGVTGTFDKLIKHIPKGIAAGMMAGILFQFGINIFKSISTMPALALAMIGIYLVFKRLLPRFVILFVLIFGILLAYFIGDVNPNNFQLSIAHPVFITPVWSWESTFSFAIPLVLVSLTGQFLPGMAILKLANYHVPAKPIITFTSFMSVITGIFGGITTTTAAITATLCTGKEANEDPNKRYVAGIFSGIFFLIGGSLAGSIVLIFTSLPKELIALLAGLALLGAIISSLMSTLEEPDHREASAITFLATASGMSFLGLGSAFWGIVIGSIAYVVFDKDLLKLKSKQKND